MGKNQSKYYYPSPHHYLDVIPLLCRQGFLLFNEHREDKQVTARLFFTVMRERESEILGANQ